MRAKCVVVTILLNFCPEPQCWQVNYPPPQPFLPVLGNFLLVRGKITLKSILPCSAANVRQIQRKNQFKK
jgi:hypothetical protein